MRHSMLFALGLGVVVASPITAFAQNWGAIAYDRGTGRWGDSWHYPTVAEANNIALNNCATDGCKVYVEIGPNQCGALAIAAANPKGYGWATRAERADAELNALENCQGRNAGQCKLKVSDCNR